MARIRTVKPELWTDPEFTECSMSARVFFIALLNFASDFGVLPDKPRQLKMQCLPADAIDVEPLIDELIEYAFLVRRTAPNGDKVLVIRTFTEHQKINRPTKGRWGNPAEWDNPTTPDGGELSESSVSPHGVLSEDSPPEGKGTGREGKGTPQQPPSGFNRARGKRGGGEDSSKKADAVADAYGRIALAKARAAGTAVTSERAYSAKAAAKCRQLDEFERYVTGYPSAPADAIAAWLHGDTHSMSYFRDADLDAPDADVIPLRQAP